MSGTTPAEKKPWVRRIAIIAGAACAIGLWGGYVRLKNYLHSEGFRDFLSVKVSRAAGVEGQFAPFHWSGLGVDSASYVAAGDGPLVSLRAEGLHTELGLRGVVRGVWILDDVRVASLDAEILPVVAEQTASGGEDAPLTKKERPRRWYPSQVELGGLEVGKANIRATLEDGRKFSLEDFSVTGEQDASAGSYSGEIRGGVLNLPDDFWPQIHLGSVKVAYRDELLTVRSADAVVWDTGRLQASGQWNRRTKGYDFRGSAKDIPLERLVRENWAKKITGTVSSTFEVAEAGKGAEARGVLSIDGGSLTALPVLEVLSAYADTSRFRELELTKARADWSWSKESITLRNLELESGDLLRIRGDLAIRGEELEGAVLLGISPKIISVVPGAESAVFVSGEDGLMWARVSIGGTVDHPKEDLSDRLITAAGLRVLEKLPGGERFSEYARDYLGDDPREALRKGKETFDEAEKAVRETRDILKGIFRK